MREKLQTLPLAELKELAKAQGIKGCTAMRKADIIDLLCKAAEQEEIMKTAVAPPQLRTAPAARNEERSEGRSEGRNEGRFEGRSEGRNDGRNEGRSDGRYERSDSRGEGKNDRQTRPARENRQPEQLTAQEIAELDSGIAANGILEVMPDGFGFIRCENFLPGENDVYVAPSQIRRFNLKTGDIIAGNRRVKTAAEKFAALLYIKNVNGYPISVIERRPSFENLTPIFPNERLHMETEGKTTTAMRVLDLLSPIGKGQRRHDRVAAEGR